jgi:hypothetical protein
MRFKLRKIGNSFGIIIPKEVVLASSTAGFIEMNVITFELPEGEEKEVMPDVITFDPKEVVSASSILPRKKIKKDQDINVYEGTVHKPLTKEICKKHKTFKYSCGCK